MDNLHIIILILFIALNKKKEGLSDAEKVGLIAGGTGTGALGLAALASKFGSSGLSKADRELAALQNFIEQASVVAKRA